jgi:hypothetical protein
MDNDGFSNALAEYSEQASRLLDPVKFAHETEDTERFNQLVGGVTAAIGGPIATKGIFGLGEKANKLIQGAKKKAADTLGNAVEDVADRAGQAVNDAMARAGGAFAGARDAAADAGDAAAGAVRDAGGAVRGIARVGDSPFGTPEAGALRPLGGGVDEFDEAGMRVGAARPQGLLARMFGRGARATPRAPAGVDAPAAEDPEFADAFATPEGTEGLEMAQRFGVRPGMVRGLARVFGVGGEAGDEAGRGIGAPRLVRLAGEDDPGAGPAAGQPPARPAPVDDAPAGPAAAVGEEAAEGGGEAAAGAAAAAGGEAAAAAGGDAAAAGLAAAGAGVDAAAAAEGGLNPLVDIAAAVLGFTTLFGGLGAEKAAPIRPETVAANPTRAYGLGGF